MNMRVLDPSEVLDLIKAGEIAEAADLIGVIFSPNKQDAVFALQLVALRLVKKKDLKTALACLRLALTYGPVDPLKTVRIMESISGPLDYPLLYEAVKQCAVQALASSEFNEALEAFCYCLHLAVYPAVANDPEKNLLYQNTLACYARVRDSLDTRHRMPPKKDKQAKINVAHVLPRLVDEWSPVKLLGTFIKYHDYEKFRVFVYTTEQDVRSKAANFTYSCFKQPSREISDGIQGLLNKKSVPYFFSDYDQSFIVRAVTLHELMQKDRIDVAVYYGHNMCCIDGLLAHLWPAFVQINIDIGTPMFIPALDAVCQGTRELTLRHSDFWDTLGVSVYHMPSGVESESDGPAPTLESFGIPKEGAVVLSTCSSQLPTRMSAEFLTTVARLLKAYPEAYYLVVGQGTVDTIKGFFSEHGLSERVKFAGHQKDVPALMKKVDIYLNEFPEGGGLSVLEAMAAGKPVVAALTDSATAVGSAGAYYAGEESSIKGDDIGNKYFSHASRLINDSAYREQTGKRLKERYHNEFSPKKTVLAYEDLMGSLYSKKCQAAAAGASTSRLKIKAK